MDLLTAAQRAQIRAAIGDVTDTFFKTPVEYQLVGESMDRFQEDRGGRVKTTFNLLGLVEYPQGEGKLIKTETNGAIDSAAVKVSFNMDDLAAYGGIVNSEEQTIFNPTKDYMIINGIKYETTYRAYDGALEKRNVLCIVYADEVIKTTK